MKTIQEKILKTLDTILENKKDVFEVYIKPTEVNYTNLSFAGRVKDDEINKTLLDDIQAAAENADVNVTIDFAVKGHKKYTSSKNISRHYSGNAVDIDFVDGKVVSLKNKDVVNRFVNALVKLGYVKNIEAGNDKSVLTFGFPGHDNHVHVSNKDTGPSPINYSSPKTDGIEEPKEPDTEKTIKVSLNDPEDVIKAVKDISSDEKNLDNVKNAIISSGLLNSIASDEEIKKFIDSQDWLKDFSRFFPELNSNK